MNTTNIDIITDNYSIECIDNFEFLDFQAKDVEINIIDEQINDQYNKKQRKKPIFKQHVKWTINEDEKLKEMVKYFGENDWRHLARQMEGRNSRQCRERWQYYLNPNLKHGDWSKEEDELILKMRNDYGPKWMMISKFFQNRTDAMIKNRYNVLVRIEKRKNEKDIIPNEYYFVNNQCDKSLFNQNNNDQIKSSESSNQIDNMYFDEELDYLDLAFINDENVFKNDSFLFENDDIDTFVC